jgi:acetyl esterase/lipase
MKLELLNPELQRAYRFIPNTPVSSPFPRALLRAGIGRMKPAPIPAEVTFEKIDFDDPPSIHVFSPALGGNGAALLFIHGGGMVIGSPLMDYPLAIDVVRQLGITVVLAGYRLAPEYPFPTPVDDCERGWNWIIDNASPRGIDTARVAIGGQSAGGGLAAMLIQRRHDKSGAQPAAQWLICPMLDDRTAGDKSLDKIKNRLWNNKSNRAGWAAFLGTTPGSADVPSGSVPSRRTNFSGLPPAWIGTGTVELFYREDVAYAHALDAAGVEVTLDEVPGAPHAFEDMAASTRIAQEYVERARRWLARQLGVEYVELSVTERPTK